MLVEATNSDLLPALKGEASRPLTPFYVIYRTAKPQNSDSHRCQCMREPEVIQCHRSWIQIPLGPRQEHRSCKPHFTAPYIAKREAKSPIFFGVIAFIRICPTL